MSKERKTFQLTLGGNTYDIPQLTRGESKPIRYKAATLAQRMERLDTSNIAEQFEVMDDLLDIIFEYAPSLVPIQEDIEAEITTEEMTEAFKIVTGILFSPFVKPALEIPKNT